MGIKENIHELKSYVSGAPAANRTKINHIIKLYEDRRIPTFNYALSKTLLLASGNENTIKSGRAEKEYDKIVAKFGKAPAEVAQQQESVESPSRKKREPLSKAPPVEVKKTYSKDELKAILKTESRKVRGAGKKLAEAKAWLEAETKDYSVRVVLYTSAENTSKEAEKKEEEIAKKKKTKYFKGLRQVFSGDILLTFKHPMVANAEQLFRQTHATTTNH